MPLAIWLSPYVQHMDLGQAICPAIIEINLPKQPNFEQVGLIKPRN